MESILTAHGKLFWRIGSLISSNNERPKCVQTYFYSRDESTNYRMINMKKTVKDNGEKDTYSEIFKLLDTTLIEANNKYIKSFLGVRDYINKHLKD